MIPASELRVGNWLNLLIKDENYGEVKGELPFQIKDPQHFAKLFQPSSSGDLFAPIPLTPEILEACGFAETGSFGQPTVGSGVFGRKEMNWTELFKQDDGSYDVAIADEGGYDIAPPIFYLHQLQNLYHSLTGQELTVNLPSNQSA